MKQILPVAQAGLIKAMSHITGGGFTENIPRVLPKDLGCFVDASTWPLPPVFRYLREKGSVEPLEMARTFNNGIGMVLVVSPENVDRATEALRNAGDAEVYRIGEITKTYGVEMKNTHLWL